MKVGKMVVHAPSGDVCVILETDIDGNGDDVCLVLHPDNEAAWQYENDLEVK